MDDNFNYEQFADRLIGELKAQVDALVAELAHQQAENERLREYIAVLRKDFAAIVGFWHEELAKNSP